MRLSCGVLAALACLLIAPAVAAAGDGIRYQTLFQDPGPDGTQDLSLENHAIALIDATPPGERITFAFRDFNRLPVANALVAAHRRGVRVDGAIDGGERDRPPVQLLRNELGPERVVICGSPGFTFNSCIANTDAPSLQHNKFLTFSRLRDGRENVVLQTSKNFFGPSQLTYYNDMLEIDGDAALYTAYVTYLIALKAQVRSDDHYLIAQGDGGRNTMFPSPRRQPDRDTNDTIVDRMDEIDCSVGGSPSGRGLIRVANMAFRTERAVIMRKLARLKRAGCDIEVVVSNADGDILAGLAAAAIPVHPFFLRAVGTRPQVIVHDKFWLVDAGSTVTGRRTKLAYVGSSNWRGDQQRSDDLLLRVADDEVYDRYASYWRLIRARAVSDPNRAATDAVAPSVALAASPDPNAAGWNRSAVTVRVAASDGHGVGVTGLRRLHVEMKGAQAGTWDFLGEHAGVNVQDLVVVAEGETTITAFAEDASGNVGAARTYVVRIDATAPAVTGLPADCVLWPPDHQLVHVADVMVSDGLSGVADLSIAATGDEPGDGDIVITGGAVDLRAEKNQHGRARTYTLSVVATDRAGNRAVAEATCVVPHSEGR